MEIEAIYDGDGVTGYTLAQDGYLEELLREYQVKDKAIIPMVREWANVTENPDENYRGGPQGSTECRGGVAMVEPEDEARHCVRGRGHGIGLHQATFDGSEDGKKSVGRPQRNEDPSSPLLQE